MPGTNQAGYPYPVGTDPIANGDDAIKALAAAVPWIQQGSVNVAGDATNVRSVAVTFPKAFPGIPTIMATSMTAAVTSATTQTVVTTTPSTTGVTIQVTRNSTATVGVWWVATWVGGGIPG